MLLCLYQPAMKPLSAGDARIWEGISEATSAENVDDQPALVADVGFGANVGTVTSVLFSMKTISLVTIYAGPLLIGIGYALVAVAVPLICLEAFGPKDFGRIQSFMFSATVLGMVAGSPLFNAFYGMSGSYNTIYLLSAVICVLMTVILIVTVSKEKAGKN